MRTRCWPIGLAVLQTAIFAGAASDTAHANDELREDATSQFRVIKAPAAAALERPDVILGRRLFWDARVSGDGRTACASCHTPADWGADRRRFSPDARGRLTARNSQTVFNAMPQPTLRWTGDRTSGAHQAEKSLTGSMGFGTANDVIPLLRSLGYEPAFRSAYPDDPSPVSPATYARALEAYQSTLTTPAAFDRYLAGDDRALNDVQKTGLRRFIDAGCASCHDGALLGGGSITKFGIFKDHWLATKSEPPDAGLFESTAREEDRYRFRVSMLRNIARTAPYFHDGSVTGLVEAVHVMADVQTGKRLSDAEATSIVDFLDALTGNVPDHYRAP